MHLRHIMGRGGCIGPSCAMSWLTLFINACPGGHAHEFAHVLPTFLPPSDPARLNPLIVHALDLWCGWLMEDGLLHPNDIATFCGRLFTACQAARAPATLRLLRLDSVYDMLALGVKKQLDWLLRRFRVHLRNPYESRTPILPIACTPDGS